ncbi:MAG: hypothetical protein ACO3UM_13725, partial [Planctomycetota bacterium]
MRRRPIQGISLAGESFGELVPRDEALLGGGQTSMLVLELGDVGLFPGELGDLRSEAFDFNFELAASRLRRFDRSAVRLERILGKAHRSEGNLVFLVAPTFVGECLSEFGESPGQFARRARGIEAIQTVGSLGEQPSLVVELVAGVLSLLTSDVAFGSSGDHPPSHPRTLGALGGLPGTRQPVLVSRDRSVECLRSVEPLCRRGGQRMATFGIAGSGRGVPLPTLECSERLGDVVEESPNGVRVRRWLLGRHAPVEDLVELPRGREGGLEMVTEEFVELADPVGQAAQQRLGALDEVVGDLVR